MSPEKWTERIDWLTQEDWFSSPTPILYSSQWSVPRALLNQ